jgi:hypothetical protein
MLRALNWFRRPSSKPARRPHPVSLGVESLEDRQVLSTLPTTMTDVANYFSTHSGPTALYLNFDGGSAQGYTAAAFQSQAGQSRDQAIQDILYRVSEIFAPFNVQVERIYGSGSISQGNGNTTVFVGAVNSDVTSSGVHVPAGFTPSASVDYPGDTKGLTHQPNSDPYDVAFVDPVSGTATAWNDQTIARAVAHEAGHTFGLTHVLSNGVNDIMTYDSLPEKYFANGDFTITDLNYNAATGTYSHDSSMIPKFMVPDPTWGWLGIWDTVPIYVQNSYTYLHQVLGTGLNHPVADTGAVDPSYASLYESYASLAPGSTFSGSIARGGDTNVFSLTSPYSQTVTITATAPKGSTLNPVIMVFDTSGQTLLAETQYGQLQFNVTAGVPYKLVVAGQDGNSSGAFHLAIGPLTQSGWSKLDGGNFQQIAVGHDQAGHQQVFAVTGDHQVYVNTEVYLNNTGSWTGWQPLGGWVKSMAITEDVWGRTQVFAVYFDGSLWVDTQANSTSWTGFVSLGGSGIQQVAVANNANGLTDVFVVGSDNAVWWKSEDINNNFSGWQRVPGWVSSIAVSRDGWGHLQIFGIGSDTSLWVATQTDANSNSFNPFSSLGYYYNLQQLAVGNDADGRCEVFAVGANGTVSHWWQDTYGYWDWGNFGALPGNVQSIQVGHDANRRLFVFGVGMDNQAWVIGQSVLNGGFGGWVPLGGTMEQLAVGNDANGNLALFGLGWDWDVYHR